MVPVTVPLWLFEVWSFTFPQNGYQANKLVCKFVDKTVLEQLLVLKPAWLFAVIATVPGWQRTVFEAETVGLLTIIEIYFLQEPPKEIISTQ